MVQEQEKIKIGAKQMMEKRRHLQTNTDKTLITVHLIQRAQFIENNKKQNNNRDLTLKD